MLFHRDGKCHVNCVARIPNVVNLLSKQRGQLKQPDHADLRYKCRIYAQLLQHLKVKLLINPKIC